MYILSGIYRGRKLNYCLKAVIRPSLARIRKMVFDTLMPILLDNDVVAPNILDGFAGSGAYGYEALSMIGGHCTFIEMDKGLSKDIKTTADDIGINDKVKIHWGNSLTVINKIKTKFDIVFLDPPYEKTFLITKLLKKMMVNGNIDEKTYIVVENSTHNCWTFVPACFNILKDKIGSSTRFMILQWNGVMDLTTRNKSLKKERIKTDRKNIELDYGIINL
jgi:16S rRNA (guanine966-N2)-methyltransferase